VRRRPLSDFRRTAQRGLLPLPELPPGHRRPGGGAPDRAECIGAQKQRIEGEPDPKHVSTSFAERQNLNNMRRFTRRTNAFSKNVENHAHSVALFATYYNFVKVHSKLRMSPPMAAGVADRLWDVADIVTLVEVAEAKPVKRGPYKKRVVTARV
jgi:hypothetical protein